MPCPILAEELYRGDDKRDQNDVIDLRNVAHRYVRQGWTSKSGENQADSDKFFWAVRGLTIGVPVGECFALLGPTGAGKSSTIALVTGNCEGKCQPPTYGEISVAKKNTVKDGFIGKNGVYGNLGVVPQENGLWGDLSGVQHLEFYSKISGTHINPNQDLYSEKSSEKDKTDSFNLSGEAENNEGLASRVNRYLEEVGLTQLDGNKPAGCYSGGMKRKLMFACAMITDPPICLLDELSAGVDAGAQRTLWKKLLKRSPDQTILLTSHSMSEVDAVCSRVGILVSGSLRCLGSRLQIKDNYGSGYQLEMLLSIHEREILDARMISRANPFADCDAVGDFAGMVLDSLANALGENQPLTLLESLILSANRMKVVVALGGDQSSKNKASSSSSNEKIKLGPILRWCRKWNQGEMHLDHNNQRIRLDDYSLGEPTLEQVFLKFARLQGEENTTK